MTISHPTSRPRAARARLVADVLRHQVLHRAREGRLELPSEPTLADDFGVSRNTVRAALDLLRLEGLVERTPGVGTRAGGGKHPHGLHQLQGLGEVVAEGSLVHNEVRAAGLVRAPGAVAHRLRLGPDEPVVYVERLRTVDGVPMSLDLTYLPRDPGEALLAEDLAHRDVFALLEEITGGGLGGADVTLEAVGADQHSASLLRVRPGAPLLMLERLTRLGDGRPVDLEFIRFRGDRITMRSTLRRTPRSPA